MRILRLVLIFLIITVPCATFVAWKKGLLEKPEPTVAERKIQLEAAELQCAYVAAYHDAKNRTEKLGAAMAHINLARTLGLTTCQVYDAFLTLVIPGENVISIRSSTADYQGYQITRAQQANFNVGVVALNDCLSDQNACFQQYPWLRCVQFEIRNTWKRATPQPDYRLRTDSRVKRVFPTGEPGSDDAEFFCPK